jgi:resuscitation-promoting factor RpfA
LSLDPTTGVGDVTGDAVADVAVWDPGYGEVFVFSGADNTWLYTLAAPDPQERGDFGRWLTGLADVSGDGVPDIVVQESTSGEVFLFSGKDGTWLSPCKIPPRGRSDVMDLRSRLP